MNQDFTVCFYDSVLESFAKRETEIRQALSEITASATYEGLYLHYQPILDLKTNRIIGVEALARFQNDQLGFVSPGEFIPIAEKTKLIIPIGERIFSQALELSNELEKRGYPSISVAINVSVVQLLQPNFASRVLEVVNHSKANTGNILLELTESVFSSDLEMIKQVIDTIKQSGISIAIDDFGTGYSSLARVRELNIDCIKIDKYFIDKLAYLDETQAVTGDIISMSHKLGHYTVAEGVEDEQQMKYLRNNHCDRVQGYLVSKPLSQADLFDFLAKYNG